MPSWCSRPPHTLLTGEPAPSPAAAFRTTLKAAPAAASLLALPSPVDVALHDATQTLLSLLNSTFRTAPQLCWKVTWFYKNTNSILNVTGNLIDMCGQTTDDRQMRKEAAVRTYGLKHDQNTSWMIHLLLLKSCSWTKVGYDKTSDPDLNLKPVCRYW